MAKVVITGASGFIGTHLTAALADRSNKITCLVRRTSKIDRLRPYGVQFAYGDVNDPASVQEAVAHADCVYHLAGCILSCRRDDFYRVNVEGTRNVAHACSTQPKPPVLIVVSSLAAAGPARHDRPLVEADPAQPVSEYGRSKLLAEKAARQYADRVPTTIVRPPIVFGEMDPLTLFMFRPIKRFGIQWVPGFARHRFSLLHAADLAQLIVAAARCGRRLPPASLNGSADGQGVYFAGCEISPAYADLARMISRALGRRWVFPIPAMTPFIWGLAACGELVGRILGKALPMNLDKAHEMTAGSWICSTDAAVRDLQFSLGAPLLERLRQTADWYRREGWF